MSSQKPIPNLLRRYASPDLPVDLANTHSQDLPKPYFAWLGERGHKLTKDMRIRALEKAMPSREAAARVIASLSPMEIAILAAYRRYEGGASGEVMRLELLARGLLKVNERGPGYSYRSARTYEQLDDLLARFILIKMGPSVASYSWTRSELAQPVQDAAVQRQIAAQLAPAGPLPWSVPSLPAPPQEVQIRQPAVMAHDLMRTLTFIADRKKIKITANKVLARPSLQALKKGVPLEDKGDIPILDAQGFTFEILRHLGLVVAAGSEMVADLRVASMGFSFPIWEQLYSWTRAWLAMDGWGDGLGLRFSNPSDYHSSSTRSTVCRESLVWALGCLAQAGDVWYDLLTFLNSLYQLQGAGEHLPHPALATPIWRPLGWQCPAPLQTAEQIARWQGWSRRLGTWYANVLMGTLWFLGIVARGRGEKGQLCFALTPWGRAILGAPEATPPEEPHAAPSLVIQPNFDVLAYVDTSTNKTLTDLGLMTDSSTISFGPVRTVRLTQASVYRALENGLTLEELLTFLRSQSRHGIPANVERSLADWSGQCDRIVLRTGTTIVAFPSSAERNAYLTTHKGRAVGDHYVLKSGGAPGLAGASTVDHLKHRHPNWRIEEDRRIWLLRPTDILQEARLRLMAEKGDSHWHLTAASLERAVAQGLTADDVVAWLEDHSLTPVTGLLICSVESQMRERVAIEMAETVILRVPDGTLLEALLESPRFLALTWKRVRLDTFLVKKESQAELRQFLEGLGFAVGGDLSEFC